MSHNKSKSILIVGIILIVIIGVALNFFYNNQDLSYFEKFDTDSDGIVDPLDAFSEDPSEWADFDFDGIGSNIDPDDDNDHVLDEIDETPVTVSKILVEKYLDQIQDCSIIGLNASPQNCFADVFDLAIKEGESTQDVLDLVMSLNGIGVMQGCHIGGHQVGKSAYENDPNFIENVLKRDSPSCRDGYLHGYLQAYFLDSKGKEVEVGDLVEVCNYLRSTGNSNECHHGMGHGFFVYNGGNLDSALNDCFTYSGKSNCDRGAIMEHVKPYIADSSTLESEISEICSEDLEPSNFEYCSEMIGRMLGYISNNDEQFVLEYCDMIQDPDRNDYCKNGFKRALSFAKKDRESWIAHFN